MGEEGVKARRLSVDEIASRTFTTHFRGFDTAEVRGFLDYCAGLVRDLEAGQADLLADLAAARAPVDAGPPDDATLLAALGAETAGVLRSAREAAADIRAKADEHAAQALAEAHTDAERVRAEARADSDRMLQQAERVLADRTAEAEAVADGLLVQARAEAVGTEAAALDKARSMVAEAQGLRERMLGDLQKRKRAGQAQLEQLQASRTSLLEAIGVVRSSLDEATGALVRAELESRRDADLAARQLAEAAAAAPVEAEVEPSLEVETPLEVEVAGPSLPLLVGLPTLEDTGQHEAVVFEPASLSAVAEPSAPAALVAEPLADRPATPDVPVAAEAEPLEAAGAFGSGVGADTEEEEAAPSPHVDAPAASAPATGEVQAVSATGTDGVAFRGGRRRQLRLADNPAVKAEEHRLAQARVLRRPRRGDQPQVATTEDGMAVIEPSSGVEAVRVLGRDAEGDGIRLLRGPHAAPAPTVAPSPAAAAPPPAPDVELPASPPDAAAEPDAPAEPVPPTSEVDALFARLRKERTGDVASARAVLRAPVASAAPGPIAPVTTVMVTAEPGPDDETLLQARDIALGPVVTQLGRRVKRVLQDEQNALLDRLRAATCTSDAAALLGAPDDVAGRLRAVAATLLADAAAAGTAFVHPDGTVAPVRVDDLAGDVATAVISDLRPRLDAALAEAAAGGVPGPLAEDEALVRQVSVSFREWRGDRVATLVEDACHAAFSRGAYVATPAGTLLRWVPDAGGGLCPDSEDNALAGATPKGEPFPTGQRHPPAHSGCRCLLVPAGCSATDG